MVWSGPRIAQFGLNGRDAAATRLVDNPDTWLAFTDLVLIDPVGTGWSRPAKAEDGKEFWGVKATPNHRQGDPLYLSKNSRAASPKYLLGESYGGFRAAKVARALQRDQGIAVSGIMMVSPLLEGALTFGGTRFALGAALQLPSLAAAELERKGTFSREKLAEAERFALTEYLTTLAGPRADRRSRQGFLQAGRRDTGLPEDVVARSRGFIRDAYIKNLRATAKSSAATTPPLRSTIRTRSRKARAVPTRARRHLARLWRRFRRLCARRARLQDRDDLRAARWRRRRQMELGRGRRRPRRRQRRRRPARAARAEPSFRLLIVNGYTDMVTPYAASRYVLDHLPAIGDPARAQLKLYRGGHMFYLDAESRHAFSADAKAFYQEP